MKVVQHPDVVEISGEELHAILDAAVQAKLGRRLAHIHWVNVVDVRHVGAPVEAKSININATLVTKDSK